MSEAIKEPVTPDADKTEMPGDLPQKYMDDILQAVKAQTENYADEAVEKQLKKRGEVVDKQHEVTNQAIFADNDLKEMGEGKSIIGSIGWALLTSGKGAGPDRIGEQLNKSLGPNLVKSLNLQDAQAGGILVQGEVLDRFFDVLRPNVAVLALNPEMLPMPSRSLQLTGFTGDMTSSYVGEPNTQEIQSEPTTGAINFSAKTQMTLVPITNQLLDSPPGPRITNFIEGQVRKRTAIRQDQALLRGAGTSFEPQGLTNWAPDGTGGTPDHQVDSAGTTLTLILQDFGNAINALETANVMMERVGMIMAPRSKNFLMFRAIDGENRPFFLEEMRGGTWLGVPFVTSTTVPINLGGGSNESEILLADFAQVLYADVGVMKMEFFAEGSYTLNATLVSSMERNEQVLRAVHEHDLQVEHAAGVYLLTAVTYGV